MCGVDWRSSEWCCVMIDACCTYEEWRKSGPCFRVLRDRDFNLIQTFILTSRIKIQYISWECKFNCTVSICNLLVCLSMFTIYYFQLFSYFILILLISYSHFFSLFYFPVKQTCLFLYVTIKDYILKAIIFFHPHGLM